MKSSDPVLWALIGLSVFVVGYAVYQFKFNPFGPGSCCRRVRIKQLKIPRNCTLFVVDGTMSFFTIKDYLRRHAYRMLCLEDLQMIMNDNKEGATLPPNIRIVGEDSGSLWALDTDDTGRITSLARVDSSASFEDCFIGGKEADLPFAA